MKFKRVFLWISGWVAAQEELDLFSRMVPLEAWESQDRHLILIFFVKTKIFHLLCFELEAFGYDSHTILVLHRTRFSKAAV